MHRPPAGDGQRSIVSEARRQILLAVRPCALPLVAAGVLAILALSGCGSSAGSNQPASAVQGHGLQGLVLKPAKPAAPLTLRNYTGNRVSLATMRGKAVFVTFVYTHCPDVCPLIVADLASAQRQLGTQAGDVRIVAVTVDPRRDTRTAIKQFLASRGALGRMDYLLGTPGQLLRTWKAWDIGVNEDGKQLTVGHTAIVYGISASGRLAVAYPSNFIPAQIVHDAPLLARM